MTEPTPPETSFHLPDPTRERPGCSRPLWIGCGLALLLVAVGLVVLVAKAPDLIDWIMRQTEEQILASLPAEVTDEERQRLRDGMRRSRELIESGRVDPLAAQQLQGELVAVSRKLPDRLTRADVLRLIETLEAFAEAAEPAGRRSRIRRQPGFLHGPVQARLAIQA